MFPVIYVSEDVPKILALMHLHGLAVEVEMSFSRQMTGGHRVSSHAQWLEMDRRHRLPSNVACWIELNSLADNFGQVQSIVAGLTQVTEGAVA